MTAPHDRYAWPQDELSRAEMGSLFGFLPDSVQDDFWSHVRGYADAQHALDQDTFFEEATVDPAPASPRTSSFPRASQVADSDPLRGLTAREYFAAITGEEIPSSGVVRCPSPYHEDRHPSCRLGGKEDHLWHCFACGAGGTVYDLGAIVSGIEPRGPEFTELQTWIANRLLNAVI